MADMKKIIITAVVLLITSISIFPQKTEELFFPREFREACKNSSRGHDGLPGKNYFQNRTDYNIKAEFFPGTKILKGNEVITWTNNSPDTLRRVFINLFQNRFRKGEARDSYVDAENIHDGVIIKSLSINGIEADPKFNIFYSTIFSFRAPEKIPPGSETKITIEWEQKMPVTGLFRIGSYGENSFFIGYWYPKIAVYDDITGWNRFGHTGNAEFYNEYGSYDVEITLPAQYNAWSSLPLLNPSEIFREKYLERIKEAAVSDSVIHIITENDRIKNNITKDADKHIWKFSGKNLPDFAFAVSNEYLWDASSVFTGSKRTPVNTVYNKEAAYFKNVTEICGRSLKFYSTVTPAVEYPYEQFTAFEGEKNGMEFPGIINDEEQESEFGTAFITTHEIAHTYFPFYVGTNEQEYSWMDESLATFVGIAALADITGTEMAKVLNMAVKKYNMEGGKLGLDIPPMAGTHSAGDFIYGFMTYTRPITAFALLYNYLGEEKFFGAVKTFIKNWKGKHPIPYDLFYTFNQSAGEDLAWFWKPWFFDLGYADLGIGKIENAKNKTLITIEKNGEFPLPVHLYVKYKDGSELNIDKKMNVWKSKEKVIYIEVPKGDIDKIILNKNLPDIDYADNKRKF